MLPAGQRIGQVIDFGQFRYDSARRELLGADGPVRIGSRALQLLAVLLESPGRLYSRDELMSRVWPQTVVEETSLRVHMSALRRVLGEGQTSKRYIANVPGRGYAFVADVVATANAAGLATTSPRRAQGLPARLTRMIGREGVIEQVGALSQRERLVSVVGAGGMGKTAVALAVAEGRQARFEHGTLFVDLSRFSDPALVIVELAQAYGLDAQPGEIWAALEAALHDKNLLIVLDNCEHVIDAVASMLDKLMHACPRVHFLATSREPIEIEAEWIFKLPPLGMPTANQALELAGLMAYPALQLFVERARAISDSFELTSANAPLVRQLCEFLDGIPLAIELAAARVDSLGVQGLLQRLENAFELMTRGRRTSLSRHRTLHAVLNWSYELLSETEQQVLQRLSVFRGAFDLDSAITVVCSEKFPRQQVVADMLGLCAKSLAVLEPAEDGRMQHRLLYVTRLFAQKRLDEALDAGEVYRRHAWLVRDRLVALQEEGASMSRYRWTAALASSIADLRSAIHWAMTEENDLNLGLEITAEARRNFYDAGLIAEYQRHAAAALKKMERTGAQDARAELMLRLGLTFITSSLRQGREGQERLFDRVRQLADEAGSVEDRIEMLFGMAVGAYGQGEYRYSLARCEEIRVLTEGPFEPLSVALADRISVLNLHALGDHAQAERLAGRVLAFDGERVGRRYLSEVPFSVSMRIRLARIHWLRGHFLLAWSVMREALALARDAHLFALVQVLGMAAVPFAIWQGERDMAREWIQELRDRSLRAGLEYWQSYGHMLGWVLEGGTLPLPESAEQDMLRQNMPLADHVSVLRSEAAPVPATLERVRLCQVGWCAPEVLRLSALAELAASRADAAARHRCIEQLQQALTLSDQQGACFWSLRILLSWCRLALPEEAGHSFARERLKALLETIDDGSGMPDLEAARQLVCDLARTAFEGKCRVAGASRISSARA